MATSVRAEPATSAAGQPRGLIRPAVAALGRLLGRPLASYYLVLGSAGLLLLLGLIMVFSASTILRLIVSSGSSM